jgi:hypothetical protein
LLRLGTIPWAVFLLLVGFALGMLLSALTRPAAPVPVPPPRTSDVRVVLSDRYLARKIATDARHVGISAVHIRSAPPSQLIATMQWTVGFVSTPLLVVAQPVAQNGQVHIRVLSAQVAGVALPRDVAQAVTDSVTGSLRRPLGADARVIRASVRPSGIELDANYAGS